MSTERNQLVGITSPAFKKHRKPERITLTAFKKMKNQQLTALVTELKKVSRENNVNIWARLASDLEKPSKNQREVNLSRLDRYCQPNDVVVVPGKVLSMGSLNKKITIAAHKFSGSALEKINASGSSAISIQELLRKNPKGSKVRIIG